MSEIYAPAFIVLFNGKLSLCDIYFAHKVNKSLMSKGFGELKWTCPLCYCIGKFVN